MTVGEAMKVARQKAGLTQEELATITGISAPSLNHYENDKHMPRVDTVEMLADTLGISIDEYVGHGAGVKHNPDVGLWEKIQRRAKLEAAKEIAKKLKSSIIDKVVEEMAGENNE